MRQLVILWHIVFLPLWAYGQSCGLSDTILVTTNSEQFIDLAITDFFNNNLAAPDQALCEVELKFLHQLSENLEVWLISPAGQTVQLIGPNTDDQFAFTFAAGWNISFVPAGETAVPDPGHPAHWDNNQPNNFVSGGIYTGSYYPYLGNLEDFNTGTVNGTWRVRVRNNPSSYSGAFLFIRLIFCDSRGVDCCFAKAGEFTAPDLTTCQGDTNLIFDPAPEFAGGPADTSEFDYTYLFSRLDTIIGYDTLVDMTGFPAGSYQVCGLSYRSSQVDSLPVGWTLDSLRTNLDSFTPKFCGQLTGSCIQVTIVPPPDTTLLNPAICDGESFSLADSTWTSTGQFFLPLKNFAGCDSIIQVNLMVYPIPMTQIDTTICAGETYTAGLSTYNSTGIYRDTLQAATGCDSIIISNLTVRAPITALYDTTICAGDTVYFGGVPFWSTGQYLVTIPSAVGCDSTITVQLTVLDISADISPPATLTCNDPVVLLDGSASAPAGLITFDWRDENDVLLGAAPTLPVTLPGSYTLLVTRTEGPLVCTARDTAIVTANQIHPVADAGLPDTLTCVSLLITLGGPNSSTGPGISYQWTTANGHFAGPSDILQAQADQPGDYTLIVSDGLNGCKDTAFVTIAIDTIDPVVTLGETFRLNCAINQDTLFGQALAAGPIAYQWAGPCMVTSPDSSWVIVNCLGVYTLEAVNLNNGCTGQAQVTVLEDRAIPQAVITAPEILNCSRQTVQLNGNGSSPPGRIRYEWRNPVNTLIGTTPQILVDQGGVYELTVIDTLNSCLQTATVEVVTDTLPPQALPGEDQTLNCQVAIATLGANINPPAGWTFAWTALEGRLTSAANQALTGTDTSGYFQLVVTDQANACSDTAFVRVFADQTPPFVNAGDDQTINCGTDLITLDGSSSAMPPNAQVSWEGPCILDDPQQLVVSVDCPGVFYLNIFNPDNFCAGRDSVEVFLNPAAPFADIPSDSAEISCINGSVLLDASPSSAGFYDWFLDGTSLGVNSKTLLADQAGEYVFEVANGDRTCVDTDTLLVTLDCLPSILFSTPDSIICGREAVELTATVSPPGPAYTYTWTGPDDGCIVEGQGTPTIRASCGGAYVLTVTNPAVGLQSTQMVAVLADLDIPFADAGLPDTLNCLVSQVILDGANSSTGPNLIYRWTDGITGELIGENLTETVTEAGTYFLEVIDTANQCSASDFVQVLQLDIPPVISFGSAVFPCDRDTFGLEAFVTPASPYYAYSWSGLGIVSGQDSSIAQVNSLGTYTLVVRNTQNFCESTNTVTVTDQICAPCLALSTPDTLTCLVQSVTLQAGFCYPCVNCVVEWTTVDGQISGPTDALTALVTEPGTYRITATDTLGFSSFVDVVVHEIATPPVVDLGPDRMLNCDSNSVRIGSILTGLDPTWSYQWATNGTGIIAVLPDERFADIIQEGSYYLQVTNPVTGCFARDTVEVIRDTLPPSAEAGPSFSLSCTQQQVILDGSGSSQGNMTYLWTTSGNEACLTGNNTLSPIARCPATYYLTVTNLLNGCQGTDSTVVNPAPDLPQVTPFPDTALTCAVREITLLGSSPGPSGYSYLWQEVDGAGNPVPGTETVALERIVSAPGRYRFELTDEGSNCRNSFVVTVAPDQTPPVAEAGPDATIDCTQGNLQLAGSVSPAGENYQINWESPEGLPIDQPETLTPTIYQPGRYFLTATNLRNGCSARDSVEIEQDINAPMISAGPDTSLTCAITQIRLTATAQTQSGQSEISWISADGGNIVSGGGALNPLINRPGTYQLTVIDPANNCRVVDQVLVVSNTDPPTAAIEGIDTLALDCIRDTLLLDAGISSTVSGQTPEFRWSIRGNGRLFPDLGAASVFTDAAGDYRLIVTDPGNGCRDTLLFSVAADIELPVVAVQPVLPLTCERSMTLLSTTNPLPAAYQSTWLDPAGANIATGVNSVTVTATGEYRLLVENTENGCQSELVLSVPIDTVPPVVRIAEPDFLDCDRPETDLDGFNSSKGFRFLYAWTTTAGNLTRGQDELIAGADRPGYYTLTIRDTVNGCSSRDSVLVEALAVPISGAMVESTPPKCGENNNDGSLLVLNVDGGTGPYRYNLDGGLLQSEPGFGPLGPGAYRLGITDINGCTWDSLVVILPAQPIEADLGPDIILLLGDSTVLTVQHTAQNLADIVWKPADFTPFGSPDQIQVKPLETTIYSVTVIDQNGCKAEDRIIVQVDRQPVIFIPNVFSPDNQGDNDRFTIYGGSGLVRINTLQIFERWGNMVFERRDFQPNDPTLGWDGNLDGRPLNAAVYVYYAEVTFADGKTAVYVGDLVLMR